MSIGVAEVAHSLDDMDGRAGSLEFVDKRLCSFSEDEIESTRCKMSSEFGADIEVGVGYERDRAGVMLRSM